MTIEFYKYQGTGNDFIIIDNRHYFIDKNDTKRIAELCDRRFGIGSDGLILLENDEISDFKMVYYNADGRESSMCGNGGRCITAFAQHLEIINKSTSFSAIDGVHEARIENGAVWLKMKDVREVNTFSSHMFLDTGSPHHVEMVKSLGEFDVKSNGAQIRYGEPYGEKGSNINFVENLSENRFGVRTYERGVEDETLSCGTGVTAVALAMHSSGQTKSNAIQLRTQGGELKVVFRPTNNGYEDIWLIGPAVLVFKGSVKW
ncbi:diaminopimelate epimerase [Winogradskyella sp. DF17]|uniref:Diaminopimelate epimerase n=1 Tax=Winogradskyella pelagia TaxID=2819984 RepID=A0ABS3T3K8_9FLAO|nr:diaminopimelate epimerase [Winogradskyella sp. DF17]MBO3117331.1 diaminopimelate epimerase [Winogradskyella sp. DF17]